MSNLFFKSLHSHALNSINIRFVWRKKIEKDVHRGVPLEEFSVKAEKRRHRERMVCT